MKKLGLKKLGLLSAALVVAAGCTVDVVFDPFGSDVSLEASWTIDGAAADATTCDELGASTVELQVWEESGDDFVTDGAWEASCSSGGFTTGPVLLAGTYRVRLVAVDAAGRNVAQTEFSRVTANVGDTIVVSGNFVPVEVFDPTGGDIDLDVAWTIDGVEASSAACASIGATDVQLQVWDAGRTAFYIDPSWNVSCASGGFVTAPILLPGTYQVRLVARDSAGTIDETDFVTVTAAAGETIVIDADFVGGVATDATLAGSWEIDGVIADATSCANAGIDSVVLSIANDAAGSDIFVEYEFDCALGSFDSRTDGSGVTVPIGPMFFSQWLALDATGAVLASSDFLELQVVAPTTHANLAVPNFPGGTTLIVNLFWETGLATGTYGTCAEAAVDTMGYDLYDSADARVVAEFDILCEEQLIIEDPLPDTYELDLTGDASDGTKWGTTCTGLTVASGMTTYDCFVDVVL